jgi:hypothetical protein
MITDNEMEKIIVELAVINNDSFKLCNFLEKLRTLK